jgi:hypothetical protein
MAQHDPNRPGALPPPPAQAYTGLLVSQLMLILLAPLGRELGFGGLLNPVLISLVSLAGLYAVSRRRRAFAAVAALAIAALAANWLDFATGWSRPAVFAAETVGMLFFAALGTLLLQDILTRRAAVSWSLITGALSVYLTLGLLFAFIFSLVATVQPDAFNGVAGPTGSGFQSYAYFSFVTLTTLGYGDITPVSSFAKSVTLTIAVAGQFYMTILIAMLVGKYLSNASEKS